MEKYSKNICITIRLESSIITSFQSGFTAGDSSVNQLVELYNTFCQALDDGKEVRSVFSDISKALSGIEV